jgi:hypothetical protein
VSSFSNPDSRWYLRFGTTAIDIDLWPVSCRNRRMMKSRIAVMAVALSFAATAGTFAANAHIGTWKVNEAKSKVAPDMGKTNTVEYVDKKDKIQVTVDGVDKDGKKTHGVWLGSTDGKSSKVKGNLAWDAMAYKVVNDRTYDITAMKDGKTTWTARSTVAADGKSRTLSMNGTGADGKKFKAKIVYDKE